MQGDSLFSRVDRAGSAMFGHVFNRHIYQAIFSRKRSYFRSIKPVAVDFPVIADGRITRRPSRAEIEASRVIK